MVKPLFSVHVTIVQSWAIRSNQAGQVVCISCASSTF